MLSPTQWFLIIYNREWKKQSKNHVLVTEKVLLQYKHVQRGCTSSKPMKFMTTAVQFYIVLNGIHYV